jgi:ribosomal protein L19
LGYNPPPFPLPRTLEPDMTNIIHQLESELTTRKLPDFSPGDTVVVQVKVVE